MKIIHFILIGVVCVPLISSIDTKEMLWDVLNECMDRIDTEHTYILNTWRGCRYDTPLKDSYVLTGDSMKPFLSENHEVTFCKPFDETDIYVGDIILFCADTEHRLDCVAHSVVSIEGGKFLTKGYNNKYDDYVYVEYKNVIGKLWKVEG